MDQMVARSGIRPILWAKLTFKLTIIYTVLVMLSCMAKADSLNITVCCLAIYQLVHTSEVTKNSFRGLVLLLLLSIAYDFIWYLMQSEQENNFIDGTTLIPQVAQWVQFGLLFFKPLMVVVYWKASIDFAAILDEKSQF